MKKYTLILLICFLTAGLAMPVLAEDTTPPTDFDLVYPAENALITQLSFGWTASTDDGSGIAAYDLYINGNKEVSLSKTTLSVYLSKTLPDGPHTVYVMAYDNAGNSTKTPERQFYVNASGPSISVMADGATIASGSTIRRLPVVQALITDPCGIDPNSVRIHVDGMVTVPALTATAMHGSHVTSYEASYKVNLPLSSGSHIIKVEATDRFGQSSSVTVAPVNVLASVSATGTPMNYPNPFTPKRGVSTKITYTLTDDGDTTLQLYDINGRLVRRMNAQAGAESAPGIGLGGRQGYNEVEWDGRTEFGDLVGNGAYLYLIVSEGRTIGSGQVAVYD